MNISPDSEVTLQDATDAHKSAIRAHSDSTHRFHRAALPHIFGPDNGYQHMLLDAALSADKAQSDGLRSLLRVACRGDVLLGYVLVIWKHPKDSTMPVTAMVADIGTLVAGRSQGIGALLLADVKDQMQAQKWDSLVADVWQDNAASHRLFAGADFDVERTEYRYGIPAAQTENAPVTSPQSRSWIFLLLLIGGGTMLAYFGR
ncbi:MAG: GNAT family N-acetyltransferase [Sulfitobacter sp.]